MNLLFSDINPIMSKFIKQMKRILEQSCVNTNSLTEKISITSCKDKTVKLDPTFILQIHITKTDPRSYLQFATGCKIYLSLTY